MLTNKMNFGFPTDQSPIWQNFRAPNWQFGNDKLECFSQENFFAIQ